MKEILYVSNCDPDYLNGGAIGTKKIIETLVKMEKEKKIRWYGVVSKEKNNTQLKQYYKEICRSKSKAYISRIFGYAEQMELQINLILKIIREKKIGVVILQNSRLGNISEAIKNNFPEVKVIQNFDNFEYEFAKMHVKNKNFIIKIIEKRNVKKAEKKALENMDLGIFLTENDKNKVENFYKIFKNSKIIPFIYKNTFSSKKIEKENQVIFTGSLDMAANIEASLFLIKNYKILFESKKLKLILAGRNPDKKLFKYKEKYNLDNILIFANPSKEEMEELLRKSLFYISPVFEGSGMKTKFLEALFYGLPILSSEHTMIGYSEEFKKEKFIKIFKENEKINKIYKQIIELYNVSYEKGINETIRDFFSLNFSEEKILKKIEEAINEI